MDILSNLPSFKNADEALEVKAATDEADEAQAKSDRINYHFSSVRNGPVNLRSFTSGQARRERHRALNAITRKGRRKQVAEHFVGRRLAAVLLGNLQGAGVVSYATPGKQPTAAQAVQSVRWVLSRFGEVDEITGRVKNDEAAIREALQRALNRWETMLDQPESQIDWTATA